MRTFAKSFGNWYNQTRTHHKWLQLNRLSWGATPTVDVSGRCRFCLLVWSRLCGTTKLFLKDTFLSQHLCELLNSVWGKKRHFFCQCFFTVRAAPKDNVKGSASVMWLLPKTFNWNNLGTVGVHESYTRTCTHTRKWQNINPGFKTIPHFLLFVKQTQDFIEKTQVTWRKSKW